jgi:predicted kinase
MPILYIFAGLPGTGKSTLARRLAGDRGSAYLRIDTIEQALRDAGLPIRGPEGYLIAYAVAVDNLSLGRDVVADSVNPLAITRNAWRDVAERCKSGFVEIEVICSDAAEHRSRVEARSTDIPNLRLPTWSDVVHREYEPWDRPHIIIDTSGQTVGQSLAALQRSLSPDNPESYAGGTTA